MPQFKLVWTNTFSRTASKFLRRHSDLIGLFEDVLRQLECNPHSSRLKLHRLKGKHRDKHSVSLTYSYRIVIALQIKNNEIYLLDVGSHYEVY